MSEDRKVDVCGGVDTHRDVHVATPPEADTAGYDSPTAAWSGLGWKAPAATAPAFI